MIASSAQVVPVHHSIAYPLHALLSAAALALSCLATGSREKSIDGADIW